MVDSYPKKSQKLLIISGSKHTKGTVSVRVLQRNKTNRTLEKKTYFKELAHTAVGLGWQVRHLQDRSVGWRPREELMLLS